MYGQLLLLTLASLTGIRAQGTNASVLDIPGFDDLPLSGEVVGTGADGTTFVISAAGTGAGDIPFTMTVVQDATHLSEVLSVATEFGANVECGYDSQGVGACTAVIAGAGSDSNAPPQTSVLSGTIPFLAVPVTTATGAASEGATQASGSATGSEADSPSASADSSGSRRTVASIGLATIFSMIFAATINL